MRVGLFVVSGFVLLACACGSSKAPENPPTQLVSLANRPAEAQAPDAAANAVTNAANEDADEESDGGASPDDADETRRIARMMKKVSAARELSVIRPVPGVVLGRDALVARVKAHVDREVPPEAIQHEGRELQMLGFVPTSFDYEKAVFELLQAQLAGFYEPADGSMYMAGDLHGESAAATLAHELDHALQDQHFSLAEHDKYVPGKSDSQSAFDALAEGDATSVMADVLLAKAQPGKTALDLPEEVFAGQVLESVSSGPAARSPHIMRTSLVSPYVYGTIFVNALRRVGGWKAVDAAWANLPTTTEQILHVEKWQSHEPALDVRAPSVAALGSGWKAVEQDTSGELGLRLTFEEWMEPENAKRAAEGWGGDRLVLAENGGRTALAIHIRYDAHPAPGSPADAPFALLQRALASTGGKPVGKDPSWVCVERTATGPLGALKHGSDIVLVAGPAKTQHEWASAGNCGLAKRWASEIAGAK
jgi:hypothetical protein